MISNSTHSLVSTQHIKPFEGSFLTLYQNIAQVSEPFAFDNPTGKVTIQYQPLLAHFVKESAFFHLDKGSGEFVASSLHPKESSLDHLYESLLNQEISVTLLDSSDKISGTVVSILGNSLLIKNQKGFMARVPFDRIFLIEGEGLEPFDFKKPFLEAHYVGNNHEPFSGQLNYLTKGLKFNTIYRLVLEESGQDELKATLTSQVHIINQTDQAFKNLHLQIVAGDLNYENGIPRPVPFERMALSTQNTNASVIEQVWEDYKAYILPSALDLEPSEHLFTPFLPTKSVNVKKSYEFHSSDFEEGSKKGKIMYSLLNDASNQLGVSLPQGKVEVYQKVDGNLQLIGQNQIANTPQNEDLHLEVGRAFDLGMRRSVKIESVRDSNHHIKAQEVTVTLKLTNAKAESAEVLLNEHLSGNIQLIEGPQGLIESSNQFKLTAEVPANTSQDHPYEITYKYLKTF